MHTRYITGHESIVARENVFPTCKLRDGIYICTFNSRQCYMLHLKMTDIALQSKNSLVKFSTLTLVSWSMHMHSSDIGISTVYIAVVFSSMLYLSTYLGSHHSISLVHVHQMGKPLSNSKPPKAEGGVAHQAIET